jgi:hypothetical protein
MQQKANRSLFIDLVVSDVVDHCTILEDDEAAIDCVQPFNEVGHIDAVIQYAESLSRRYKALRRLVEET